METNDRVETAKRNYLDVVHMFVDCGQPDGASCEFEEQEIATELDVLLATHEREVKIVIASQLKQERLKDFSGKTPKEIIDMLILALTK